MNLMDIPYNLDYYFDDHLREVPVSKTDMVKGIEFLKKQSHKIMENSEDLAKVYSLIGVYSRILYDIEDSKKYLTSAIKINEQLEYHKYLFVNKLRLAHTFQWGESFDTSNSLFKELIRLTENNEEYNDYLDFLFQHYGKNLFDQKEYQRALNYFERALQIRMEKGNKELIHSTQHAINICIKEQS